MGGLNALAANNWILTVHSDAAGNIYAGGEFTDSPGYRYVAKYDGTSWSELYGLNVSNTIWTIKSDAAGNIY